MKGARKQIVDWAEQGRVAPNAIAGALALAGVTPDAARWRRFVDALFLWLGSLLLAAGVIFFFAYNWDALGRFAKFGLVEGLISPSPEVTPALKAVLGLTLWLLFGLLAWNPFLRKE